MATTSRIRTPLNVRWRRLQYQLVPVLTVALCALVAWRLWQSAPRVTAVGQVSVESSEVRSPAAGVLLDLPGGNAPRLFDAVAAGQVVARLEHDGGQTSDVVAPASGQIVALHRRPGDAINRGQVIVSIAPDRGRFITTYVRSEQRVQPQPGMAVDVRSKSDPSRSYRTIVQRVGPQFEPVPAAQLRDRKTEEWGVPVVIAAPPDAPLKPGELVYIGWHAGGMSPIP